MGLSFAAPAVGSVCIDQCRRKALSTPDQTLFGEQDDRALINVAERR